MDAADRLGTGEKIAAVSAILLFIFMFFDWFGVEVSGVSGFSGSVPGAGGSAWDALDWIPIVLVVAILAALVLAALRLSDAAFEPPVPMSVVVTVLGAISVLLILYRIVDPPSGGDFGGVSVDITRELGIFLSLIAAAGLAYGGYRAMEEEGATFGDAADRLGGGSGPGGPAGGPGAGPGAGGSAEAPPPPPPSSSPPPPPPPPTSGA